MIRFISGLSGSVRNSSGTPGTGAEEQTRRILLVRYGDDGGARCLFLWFCIRRIALCAARPLRIPSIGEWVWIPRRLHESAVPARPQS
jgi:hypothetical protein